MSASNAELLRSVDPADLGSRVRAARVAKGWTQTELAGEEISVGYVSRIESGSRRPNLKVLGYLASRLGTPVDQLLRGVSASEYDEIRLGLDYAELALESGEALDAERQAREQLARAEKESLAELTERGRYLLARSLEALGDLDEAITELETLVETATGLTAIRGGIALCRCYRETGDLALAIEAGERIEKKISAWGLGQTDEAVQLTATVASAFIERGDLHRAARMCSDAVRRAEDLTSARARAGAYWNASIVHAKRGDVQAALPLASRALALLTEGQDGRNLARLRAQLGEFQLQLDPPEIEAALENLSRARADFVSTSAGELDLVRSDVVVAQAHLMAGEPERALELATSAGEAAGEGLAQVRAEALVVRGQALAAMHRPTEAHDMYREAVLVLTGAGADRSAAQLWFELADLLEELGDMDGARQAYRSAAATSGLTARRPVRVQAPAKA